MYSFQNRTNACLKARKEDSISGVHQILEEQRFTMARHIANGLPARSNMLTRKLVNTFWISYKLSLGAAYYVEAFNRDLFHVNYRSRSTKPVGVIKIHMYSKQNTSNCPKGHVVTRSVIGRELYTLRLFV